MALSFVIKSHFPTWLLWRLPTSSEVTELRKRGSLPHADHQEGQALWEALAGHVILYYDY